MRRITALFLVSIGLVASESSFAASAGPGGITTISKYVLGVADMDRSYEFYRALGMEQQGPTASERKRTANAMVQKLTGSPAGATFRFSMLKIPGADFLLEFTEFGDVDLQAARPRVQDPGATIIVLKVRDISTSVDAVRKLGAEIVAQGSHALGIEADGATAAVVLRDPDGYYLELLQVQEASADRPASNIAGASFAFVVHDAVKATGFYRDLLGLDAHVLNTVSAHEVHFDGTGGHGWHRAMVTDPRKNISWTFLSYDGPDRKAHLPRIADPGASVTGLQVTDLDTTLAVLEAAGIGPVGEVVRRPQGGGIAFVRDPQGVLVELLQ